MIACSAKKDLANAAQTVESHSQKVKQRHFVLVKRPELSQKDKDIQTKVTNLFGKRNEEKVQIFVFKHTEEKPKAVGKI